MIADSAPFKAARGLVVKILTNKTVRQSLQINALRAVSLGIGFVGSIWSSRCLGPEKLGISGIIIGMVTPLVLLINLNQSAHYVRLYRGYTTDAERAALVSTICTYKITTTIGLMLISIPLLLLNHFPISWHLALWAAFPYFFLTANTADWLLQCEDKVPVATMALAVQTVITTTLYIIFFRPGMSAGADLVITDIGLAASFIMGWYLGLNGRSIRFFQWNNLPRIFPLIKEGVWLTLIGFAVYIFTTVEAPLVGWLYSLKELGIYRTSISLVAGVQAFTNYIPMLLYPRMIEWHREGPAYLWQRQKKVMGYFALFSPCICVAAFVAAPFVYHALYGPAFQKGAYPFVILLAAKLMAVLSGILSWGMAAQKKERALFKIMVYVAVFSISCNLIFIPVFGAYAASSVNLLSEVLMFALIVTFTRRSLRNE
jgi:O-antigen/teichoic acid export membrane protein